MASMEIVLRNRDKMNAEEAAAEVADFESRVKEHIEAGGSPFDCEEWLLDEYSLEPDYLEPILSKLGYL